MSVDIRVEAAKYYDAGPKPVDDIPFYKERIPSPDSTVLELGCGTGRVLVPLSKCCRNIHGLDLSESMISICRKKLDDAGVPPSRAGVQVADITHFDLDRKFELIIAPFRVFQNLETDAEVEGLFRCVRNHLSPEGSCILNVFNPKGDRENLLREWCNETENFCWEAPFEGGHITCHDRRSKMDRDKLILYPELIYRRYEENTLQDEVVLKIVMRCYFPKDFEELIAAHGFQIINRWGGYSGEPYGEGPELVVQFKETPNRTAD